MSESIEIKYYYEDWTNCNLDRDYGRLVGPYTLAGLRGLGLDRNTRVTYGDSRPWMRLGDILDGRSYMGERIETKASSASAAAKVHPYHTTIVAWEDQRYSNEQRSVYHDHVDCPDGKAIKPWHRNHGTGGLPRCKVCIKLG
jgi:hypothetical protein